MSKTVTIDLVVGDPSKIDAMFDKWDKGLKNIQDQTDKLKASMSGVYMPPPGGGGGGYAGGGGGGGFRRRGGGSSGSGGSNILDDLQQARVASVMAKANGGDPYWKDQAARRAQMAVQALTPQALAGDMKAVTQMNQALNIQKRNTPNSTMSKIQDAFMTSRLGMGAGGMQIMPLVNKLSALHPAATAAVGALTMFAAGVGKSNDSLQQRLNDVVTLGGNPGVAAGLDRDAKRIGMSGSDIASRVEGALEGSDLAKSELSNLGINPVMGVNGNMDYAGTASEVLKKIAQTKNFDERRRIAKIFRIEEAAKLGDLSAEYRNEVGTPGRVLTERDRNRAADAGAGMADFQKDMNNFVNGIFDPFITIGVETNKAAKRADGFGHVLRSVGNGFTEAISPIGSFVRWLDKLNNPDAEKEAERIEKEEKEKAKSQKDLTVATVQLTMAIKNGINGGGVRIQGAVPGQIRSQQLADKAYRDALKDGIL